MLLRISSSAFVFDRFSAEKKKFDIKLLIVELFLNCWYMYWKIFIVIWQSVFVCVVNIFFDQIKILIQRFKLYKNTIRNVQL